MSSGLEHDIYLLNKKKKTSSLSKTMTLVQCIQDQASYYKQLLTELRNEAHLDNELLLLKTELDRLVEDIRIKKSEIAALEDNS